MPLAPWVSAAYLDDRLVGRVATRYLEVSVAARRKTREPDELPRKKKRRYQYKFTAPAKAELNEATAWYEAKQEDLGGDFVLAVKDCADRIAQAPDRWPVVDGARKLRLRRFPYSLVYRIDEKHWFSIIAVAHAKRKPRYWQNRLAASTMGRRDGAVLLEGLLNGFIASRIVRRLP